MACCSCALPSCQGNENVFPLVVKVAHGTKGKKKPEVVSQLFEIIWVTSLVKTTDDDTLEKQLDNQDFFLVTTQHQVARQGARQGIMHFANNIHGVLAEIA